MARAISIRVVQFSEFIGDNPNWRLSDAANPPAAMPHKSETAGGNRRETRELTVFPAKAWFRGSPWDGLIQTVLRLERTVCKRDPKTGLCKQTDETVFWVSSASNQTPERWNDANSRPDCSSVARADAGVRCRDRGSLRGGP